MDTAILELLLRAKTGQQHVENSSHLKDIRAHFFSTEQPSVCSVHHTCTCVNKVLFYISSVLKKYRIKVIEFYQQNLPYCRAGGTTGSQYFFFYGRGGVSSLAGN